MFTSSLHLEVLGTPRISLQRYHPGTFHGVCNAKPVHFLFWPEDVEGAF